MVSTMCFWCLQCSSISGACNVFSVYVYSVSGVYSIFGAFTVSLHALCLYVCSVYSRLGSTSLT